MIVFFSILAVVILVLGWFIQRGGGFGFPWMEFYIRGKEAGFRFQEINLLRQVAVENRLKDPASLYWSERILDRCLRGTIVRFRAKGSDKDPKSVDFLSKLFDFRKQVEFSLPKYRVGLRSSRNIVQGQRIRIPFQGAGVYESQVVENMRKYMAISHPRGKALPPGFSWQGEKINVYFWRAEDAGYFFETKVLGDFLDRKYPILHIAHSDNLVRNQKRGSIRVNLALSASLYPLKTIDQANETPERVGGYRCKMLDLSEDGFAIIVGGRAKAGLPIKLQFSLNDSLIVMCGIVKGVNFNQKNNQSILHVQAVKPGAAMKIDILTYVYGIFNEGNGKEIRKPAPAPAAPESSPASSKSNAVDG